MANETVISRETAAVQIKQLLDYYEFDLETLPDALRNVLTSAIKQIEGGIMRGRLEVESTADSCIVKQHLKSPVPGAPNPIIYKEVSGKAKIGIRDDSSNYGKIYAFLGALSTEGAQVFQNMKGKDLSLAEALGSLFLQV